MRGGGGQGPLMGEEVRLWVNGSAYRSVNMIWVCVEYIMPRIGGLNPPLPFSLCLWLMVLMVCPPFSYWA